MHGLLGAIAAVYLLIVFTVSAQAGHLVGTLVGLAGICFGYEGIQAIRREGKPELKDALAGIIVGAPLLILANHFGMF